MLVIIEASAISVACEIANVTGQMFTHGVHCQIDPRSYLIPANSRISLCRNAIRNHPWHNAQAQALRAAVWDVV